MADVITGASLLGTALGICARVPRIARVVHQQSAADVSTRAVGVDIASNMCFLVYSSAEQQWPILLHNVLVIALDGALLALCSQYRGLKKVSSGTDLPLMAECS